MAVRPTPFELVFGNLQDRFERIRQRLAASGRDPEQRDSFLLQQEVAELLRELRPEPGLGAGMEALAAFVHHAYRFWGGGERVRVVTEEVLVGMLAGDRTAGRQGGRIAGGPDGQEASSQPADLPSGRPATCEYVQLPLLVVWAHLEAGPPEPIDGWFAAPVSPDELSVLAILGLYAGRAGFTAVEVGGSRPDLTARADGSPLFAPLTTETGAQAGLASVQEAGELLELAWWAEEIG